MRALLLAAIGVLAVPARAAEPYVRLRAAQEPSHCLWWPAGQVTVTQSAQGSDDIAGEAELEAISRSMQTWRGPLRSCGNLTLEEAPRTTDRTIGMAMEDGATNTNLVLFRAGKRCADAVPAGDACLKQSDVACANKYDCWMHQAGALALTTSRFDPRTGRIFDADIELNGGQFRFTASDGGKCTPPTYEGCVYYDVENTITHEVGHLLGLDHAPDPTSTMYADAKTGETSKRSLDPGSLEFVCEVYPAGAPSQDCILERLDPRLGPASLTGCAAAPAAPLLLVLALLARALRSRRA